MVLPSAPPPLPALAGLLHRHGSHQWPPPWSLHSGDVSSCLQHTGEWGQLGVGRAQDLSPLT